ncbi:MAG: hypothetical protein WD068_03660 [Candidatus Babeliales bacterium]
MRTKSSSYFYYYALLSLLCLLAGGLFFAFYHGYIIIRSSKTDYNKPISLVERRTINVYFHKHDKERTEQLSVLWYTTTIQDTLQHIINRWLRVIEEEHLPYNAITLQSVITTPTHEAYLSFDRSPFVAQHATTQKMQWLEDLLKTIRMAKIGITSITFLSNHAPLDDTTLDFEIPWPITGFESHSSSAKSTPAVHRSHKRRHTITIALYPSDPALQPLAKKIKELLEQRKTIAVRIVSKTSSNQFDVAQSINKTGATYYILINSYTATLKKPHITLYSYAHSALPKMHRDELSFITWDAAYLITAPQLNQWNSALWELKKTIIWLPYKPLKGITLPAVAFECAWYAGIEPELYAHDISEAIKKTFS